MDNKSIFKSKMFGGFERQSVLNYIYDTFNSSMEAAEKLTAKIGEMSATRKQLEESVKNFENHLAENETPHSSMSEELRRMKAKNAELEVQITELEVQTAKLAKGRGDTDFKTTMFGGFERQSVLDYINETFNNTWETQEKLTAQIGEISATRKQLGKSVKNMENRLAENETPPSSISEEFLGIKAKSAVLEAQITKLGVQAAKLTKGWGGTYNNVYEAQEKLTAQIGEMSDTRKQLEESVKNLEDRLAENETAPSSVSKELRGVKAKNAELEVQIAKMEVQIADMIKGLEGDE